MKASETHTKQGVHNEREKVEVRESKVGTWISVSIVGLVILGTYFLLYGLYMARI